MRVAVVETGVVTNIVEALAVEDIPNGVADPNGEAWIGGEYDGSTFEPLPVKPPPTPEEIDAQDVEKVDTAFALGTVDRVLAQALFQVVNEVRDLKGQGPLTVPQFKNYLKSLIR